MLASPSQVPSSLVVVDSVFVVSTFVVFCVAHEKGATRGQTKFDSLSDISGLVLCWCYKHKQTQTHGTSI